MSMMANSVKEEIKVKSLQISEITKAINNISFIREKDNNFSISDHVFYLLTASENSDAKTRCKIENHLVKMGEEIVPYLINSIEEVKGSVRGLVAMTLIRIGKVSVKYLEKTAEKKAHLNWVCDYIVNEIRGTQISLTTKSYQEVLVG